ncbi:hypothetical protein TGDOM2_365540 [Toxoplasma gondii GAB2-2007-GAL-DOM2]|uniref:Uncharacterized protein n=2 Tax=Toxoplasma gondii TaxID=5811 RepID=A0A086KLW3_TOXGO|nr:hypothetical protein TGDOM2_365540 [Toxoplasma gondii GAB2-2007-GAL-DOM2]KFH13162.1 hypothetical protein TGVAND_365540 [Toxoplasma gondii VAND]
MFRWESGDPARCTPECDSTSCEHTTPPLKTGKTKRVHTVRELIVSFIASRLIPSSLQPRTITVLQFSGADISCTFFSGLCHSFQASTLTKLRTTRIERSCRVDLREAILQVRLRHPLPCTLAPSWWALGKLTTAS